MPRLPYPKTVDLNCENCHTLHTDVPVDSDEDGYFADLDTVPCEDDECTKRLCSSCPQFTCECGGVFCLEQSHIGAEIELDCEFVDGCNDPNCPVHHPRPGQSRVILLCRLCAAAPQQVEEVEPITVGFEAAFAAMEKEVA